MADSYSALHKIYPCGLTPFDLLLLQLKTAHMCDIGSREMLNEVRCCTSIHPIPLIPNKQNPTLIVECEFTYSPLASKFQVLNSNRILYHTPIQFYLSHSRNPRTPFLHVPQLPMPQ
ncbi:hypothetical protein EYC84_003419 [Monilinia fructicola]|uniref:Uncharacterized protein n=1 Tax=Monilinia fructicola TaxID=38448 RepID=A0A5M9JXH4_MONFR|nr:hypothetical protein EYC84_003419 [Monilinia fructicola]